MALENKDLGSGAVLVTPRPSAAAAPSYNPSADSAPPVAPVATPDAISTPAFNPDWAGLLQNDSGYQAASSAATAADQSAAAARRAAVRSSYISYGGDMPAGFADTYGDIDQATIDAAKGNQYSKVAGLNRSYEQSVEQFRRALAARGMIGSGDMNYGQAELDRSLGQGRYDAANALGNDVQGALNGYAGVLNANQGNLANAISAAEANQYANPANRPVASKSANHDPALSAQYGQPVYTDDAGNMYDINGKPITAPAAAAPSLYDPNSAVVQGGYGGFDVNGNWIG